MGTIRLSDINKEAVSGVQKKVEDHSNVLAAIVTEIIDPYCRDLDRYVMFIRECLKDGETPPTNDELDDFCMNLSTLIYFAGGMCEQLGLLDFCLRKHIFFHCTCLVGTSFASTSIIPFHKPSCHTCFLSLKKTLICNCIC